MKGNYNLRCLCSLPRAWAKLRALYILTSTIVFCPLWYLNSNSNSNSKSDPILIKVSSPPSIRRGGLRVFGALKRAGAAGRTCQSRWASGGSFRLRSPGQIRVGQNTPDNVSPFKQSVLLRWIDFIKWQLCYSTSNVVRQLGVLKPLQRAAQYLKRINQRKLLAGHLNEFKQCHVRSSGVARLTLRRR